MAMICLAVAVILEAVVNIWLIREKIELEDYVDRVNHITLGLLNEAHPELHLPIHTTFSSDYDEDEDDGEE